MAFALPTWREPAAILELADLGVAEREGVRRADIVERLSDLGTENVRFFDMPRIDISSSLVRRLVAAGRPIRYLVPDAVGGLRRARGAVPMTTHRSRPARRADRRLRGRQEGDRPGRARPARRPRLHRLLRHLHGQHRPPDQGDPRPHPRGPEEGARAAPAARRGARRVALDPHGLPRRGRPRLHARGARVLPARAALGRGAQARRRRVATIAPHVARRTLLLIGAGWRSSAGSSIAAIMLVERPRRRPRARGGARPARRLVVHRHGPVRVVAAPGQRHGRADGGGRVGVVRHRPERVRRRPPVHDRDRARRAVPRHPRAPAAGVPGGPGCARRPSARSSPRSTSSVTVLQVPSLLFEEPGRAAATC